MKVTKMVFCFLGIVASATLLANGIGQAKSEQAAGASGKHAIGKQPPKEVVWEKPNRAVFNHSYHVDEIGLECSDCHNRLFAKDIGAALTKKDFNMASFKKGKYCGACHNGEEAFDSQTQCDSCHFAPKRKIVFTKPVKAVVFDHKIHVGKAKIKCETCHKKVFIMRKAVFAHLKPVKTDNIELKDKYLEKLHKRFCGTCHDSNTAFGFATRCTVCHIGVKGYALLNKEGKLPEDHH